MNLLFRMHTPDDKPGLLKLWTEKADWDKIDASTWEHRFGNASICIAIDTDKNEIVGQIIFIPFIVCIDGQNLNAYRPFATFLVKKARNFNWLNPKDHALFKMFELALNSFKHQNISLIFAVPDPLWGRILRILPGVQAAKFPLWSFWFSNLSIFTLSPNYKSEKINPDHSQIDSLWLYTSAFLERSLVRNSKILKWKTSHFNYSYTGLFLKEELVGFASSRFKSKDRQWLICDILAKDSSSFAEIIKACVLDAIKFKELHPEKIVDKVAILATTHMFPLLVDLNFKKDDYEFLFITKQLDTTLNPSLFDPQKWFVSAND